MDSDQKAAYLECFQLSLYLVSYCFQKKFTIGISIVRASCLCIIHSSGQGKFSLDKYIMAIYLSLGKCDFFLSLNS